MEQLLTATDYAEQIANLYPRAERDETGALWAEICRLEDLRRAAEQTERNRHVAEPFRSILNAFSAPRG